MNLRDLREMKLMTQKEVARAAGLSWSGYQAVETGRRVARLKTRREIAGALGVEPHEIAWREETNASARDG